MKRTTWTEGTTQVEVSAIKELKATEKSELFGVELADGRQFILSYGKVGGQRAFDIACDKLGVTETITEFTGKAELTVTVNDNGYNNFRLAAVK